MLPSDFYQLIPFLGMGPDDNIEYRKMDLLTEIQFLVSRLLIPFLSQPLDAKR